MDKEQLKQIKYIKSEIDVIENQINSISPVMVMDKVNGSSANFPYTHRSFTLEGLDYSDYNRRVRLLQNKLIKRKTELLELQEKVNDFINDIEDSLIRQIITLRYSEGLSWYDVAAEIGGNNSAESVRKISERFLEKL